jgi:DNA-binding CsgD family transcriptional regulator
LNKRHTVHFDADGGTHIPSLPFTMNNLLKHAERFGVEGVLEAAEGYLSPSDLARLKGELARIALGKKRGRFAPAARTARITAADLLALSSEGHTNEEIASMTGKTPKAVETTLRKLREEEETRREAALLQG